MKRENKVPKESEREKGDARVSEKVRFSLIEGNLVKLKLLLKRLQACGESGEADDEFKQVRMIAVSVWYQNRMSDERMAGKSVWSV